ncbi:MAG TPA: signal peptidase I [Acidimicrobiales bacterium]|nr:signal peptidase I [Acidimicrobiales bacterium]
MSAVRPEGAPPEHPEDDPPGAAAPPKKKDGGLRNVLEWVLIIGGAFLVAFVVKTFLIQAFFIPSGSMLPTLHEDDRVLVNKLSYDLHDVNRGDLVVFERPEGETAGQIKDLIKRVVALPGERIEQRDGDVYIDGQLLEEPYLDDGTETTNLEPQTVPEDHVFVMGDNRDDSMDSRVFSAIDEDLIVGRAFVRVWPLNHLGLL